MRARKVSLPCLIARARGRARAASHMLSARVSRVYPDRSLPVRALLLGFSEKQREFQTYHAAPDDEAAACAASASDGATLDDVREAVTTLESIAPLWKRIFGEAHPETPKIQEALANVREMLATRVAASSGAA